MVHLHQRKLCHSHSLLLSSYLFKIIRKENSSRSASGHHLQDLTHLLDCPASETLRRNLLHYFFHFDLWSRQMGLRGVPPRLHRSKGSGSTATVEHLPLLKAD